jgi:hypothetical protein
MKTNRLVPAVTGKFRIGNFIVLDLGTHKAYGVKAALTSRVEAVELLSGTTGSECTQQAGPQNPLDEHLSGDTHAQWCSLGTSA